MKRVWGIALLVGVGLLFAGASQAKTTPHRVKCRAGYVRRTVWVPKRSHGRIVRTYGLIVYTRVQRCVKVKKAKAPAPPATGSTPPTLSPPFAPTSSPMPFSPPPPPPGPPENTAPPTIRGTATEGYTLSASTGTWSNGPTSYSYQWQRCNATGGSCSPTPGTTPNYSLSNADVGSTLRVSITASSAGGSTSATSGATKQVGSGASPGDPVVVAVGDIACAPGNPDGVACEQSATEAVAASQNPDAVFVLGDNQYDSGSFSEYTGAGAYGSTWGFFNPIVHPVPGNHEYLTSGAAGYFQYFGQATANPDTNAGGYYSFNLGSWHIVALNSNCSDQSGCADALTGGTTSPQTAWLQRDLATNQKSCVLAMWHHPLFSSGWTLGTPGVLPLWQALYSAHADVVLSGHDHVYERYAQMDPSGAATTNGVAEFVVGTGGESLNGVSSPQPPLPYPLASANSFGVLVLKLHASSYSWSFVDTGGRTLDSGTTACHGSGTGSSGVLATRIAKATNVAALSGPPLAFDAHPLPSSLTAALRRGLPVAVHLSRAADVTVTVSVRRGRRLQRIASFYETESQLPKPYSEIFLRVPARRLTGLGIARLVVQFVAIDSAGHRRVERTTVSLGSG